MNPPKARTTKRGPHHLPEVALARGPLGGEGIVGDGSYQALFGGVWALVQHQDDKLLHLYRLELEDWVDVGVITILHDGREIRHIALCFDQAARPLIAWERNSHIWVRFWNPIANAFELEHCGPGVDPVLLMDAQLNGIIGNSDAVLFYLNQNRQTIHYRLQRDRWSINNTLTTLPQIMYLDQAIALPWRYELWLGNENTISYTLRSALYPVDVGTEYLQGSVNAVDGRYLPARLDASANEALAGQIQPRPGVYMPAAIYPNPATEALAGQIQPRPGQYALAVIRANPATEAMAGQIQPLNGRYYL